MKTTMFYYNSMHDYSIRGYIGSKTGVYMGSKISKIFDKLLNTCDHNKYNDYIFARDIIWMTLNIIDYLVGFKQYLEAQRILEVFQKCGGFCSDFSKTKPQADCGCAR